MLGLAEMLNHLISGNKNSLGGIVPPTDVFWIFISDKCGKFARLSGISPVIPVPPTLKYRSSVSSPTFGEIYPYTRSLTGTLMLSSIIRYSLLAGFRTQVVPPQV